MWIVAGVVGVVVYVVVWVAAHAEPRGDSIPEPSTQTVSGRQALSTLSEAAGSSTPTPVAVEPHSIDINLASVAELKTLPGIGEVKAQAIVDHRELNGPFESVEGLIEVKGIGPATLDKVREFLAIQ